MISLALCLVVLGGTQGPEAVGELPLAGVAARFSPCDVDADGTAEVRLLTVIGGAGLATASRVVVLVEARIAADPALLQRLQRFAADLAAEGYRADIVSAELYSGPRHQDGRIVLGVRRFLQACREAGPLAGAVLVGHFPDALLVRTCNWRRGDGVELVDAVGAKRKFAKYLRRVPEPVALRCDTVLADLDGEWERCYFEGATDLPSVSVGFEEGAPMQSGAFGAVRETAIRYRDAFHVADGALVVDVEAGTVIVDDDARDLECALGDREAQNPIAQPEISVSRIDARGIAWSPMPGFRDEQGLPKTVTFAEGETMPAWNAVWERDAALEVQLLVEYFDRNHAFRREPLTAAADRPASIAWELGSGMATARRARTSWREFQEAGYDVTRDVDLNELLRWFRRPAVFRTLRAHSNPLFAAFAKTDTEALVGAIGGPAWSFTPRGRELVPSLSAASRGGHADFFFYRTLWANRALPPQGYLMVHTGCEAIAPPGAMKLAYDHPSYGKWQQAEAMLFYTPCLALAGRAKVFYDEPRGFSEVLAKGGTFGDAWRRYFAEEAASTWGAAGGDIGRKRAYFWSLLGDFTLRLP